MPRSHRKFTRSPRITLLIVGLAAALSVLVALKFKVAYVRLFAHFVEQVTELAEADVVQSGDRLRALVPFIAAGGMENFQEAQRIRRLAAALPLERPQDAAQLRFTTISPETASQRIDMAVAHYGAQSVGYLYVVARISRTPLRLRTRQGRLDSSSDRFELSFQHADEPLQTRWIVFDAIGQAGMVTAGHTLIAKASAYPVADGLPETSTWDRAIQGNTYQKDGAYLLVLRLESPAWVEGPPSLAIRWVGEGDEVSMRIRQQGNADYIGALLEERLGSSPPKNLETLSVKLPDGRAYAPTSWPKVAEHPQSVCAPTLSRSNPSLWMARRLLFIDLCAQVSKVVAALAPTVGTEDAQVVFRRTIDSRDGRSSVVMEATYPFAALFERWREYSEAQFKSFAWPFVAIIVLTAMTWWLILRRVRRLRADVEHAWTEDTLLLSGREYRARDELGYLAHSIRTALKLAASRQRRLLRTNAQILEQNKILQQMRKVVGHEIRNPLQPLMEINAGNPEAMRQIKRIMYAVEEVLETSADEDQREISDIELAEYVSGWVDAARQYRQERAIVFIGPDAACPVRVNVEALEDALDHIYSNARDFRVPRSPIEVTVTRGEAAAVITIRNTGPQIDEHILPTLFNYGVSTRSGQNEHLGQGLARVRSLVARMSGTVEARNHATGVELIITLPLVSTRRPV